MNSYSRYSARRTIPWEAGRAVGIIPIVELFNRQRAIIVGSLLGDACLERNGTRYRLRMEHSDAQKAYVLWKCSELSHFVTDASPMKVEAFHPVQKKTYVSWRMYTRTHDALGTFAELFYRNGTKSLPENLGDILTDPLSVAVWFMDDGYKRSDCNAFRISTDSFSFEENKLLQKVLAKNFGIHSSIHRKGVYWNLYIPQKFARDFVTLTKSHMLPSLSYKIALAP